MVFGWADVSIALQMVEQLMFNVTIMCVFQVIYTSFGGSAKGLHFNNLIVGLVLLTRGRDEEKAKCKLLYVSRWEVSI